MEILKYTKKHLNYKDVHTQILVLAVITIVIVAHIYYVVKSGGIDVIQMICQMILMVIIYIWIYGAPKFYNNIKEQKKIFKSSEYKKCYKEYMALIHKFNFNEWSIRRKIFEIVYAFIWFFVFINSVVLLYYFGIFSLNIIGYITISLFAIAVLLNYFSCYLSFAFAFYIRQVSNIKGIRYNKYLPSASWGLQVLKSNLSNCLVTYFIVTTLYALFFTISMFFSERTSDMIILIQKENYKYFSILITSILTSFSFLAIYLLPSIFLQRLFLKWKYASLKELEEKLIGVEQSGDKQELTWVIERIKEVSNDKIREKYLDVMIAVTTVVMNVLTIIIFIIDYV